MEAVAIAHRNAKSWSDYVALGAVKTMRSFFDLITGYRHDKAVVLNKQDAAAATQKYAMTERKYMIRNIFLESIAGMISLLLMVSEATADNQQAYQAWLAACYDICVRCGE